MDILDKIKLFINDSIHSLFIKQKEDISLIIHREKALIVSELKTFIGQQAQTNERDMANMQQNVFSLSQSMECLMNKLDSIQEAIDKLKEQQTEVATIEIQDPPITSKPKETVFYAKMVDSTKPLGFKVDNLKSTADGCAFKITLKDDEGYYEIIDDAEIQQEMLAAFNPLISDSSTFDFIPQNPTRISVVQEGIVVKEENLLRIVNKQKIEIK